MLLLCSVLTLGDGIFFETTANARVAPQKTVLVVLSKFLKCSCIEHATIINRHYGESSRAHPVLYLLFCVCVYTHTHPPSICAAIWERSCEVWVTRCAWRCCVFVSGSGISAAKCDVLQLLEHWQHVYTPKYSERVVGGCYKQDEFVCRSFIYILNTTWRLSFPRCLLASVFPTTYSFILVFNQLDEQNLFYNKFYCII